MRRRHTLAALLLLGTFPPGALAQRLPVSTYGVEDGLPSAYVQYILQDSRGFLWFATRDGLARFDGDRFVTYSVEHGIPDPTVNHIIESRSGQLWIATNGGGVGRFEPQRAGARITPVPIPGDAAANRVNTLLEDHEGRIWAATDNGIWRFDPRSGAGLFVRLPHLTNDQIGFSWLAETPAGEMWAASSHGLFKFARDDRISHLAIRPDATLDQVSTLMLDRRGRLWVGHRFGLMVMDGPRSRWVAELDGKSGNSVITVRQGPDDRVWALMTRELIEFENGGDGPSKRYPPAAVGITDDAYAALHVDRDELWLGTVSSGVVRVNWTGFTTWASAGTAALTRVHSLQQESGAVAAVNGEWEISRFDGRSFHNSRLQVPAGSLFTWRSEVAHFDAKTGWWALTTDGLWAFGGGRTTPARSVPRHYDTRDGLVGHPAVMYRDSHGRLWVGTRGPIGSGLFWWDSQTDRFVPMASSEGLPATSAPSAFAEDRDGQLWVGTYEHGLARYTNGRFRMFTPADGAPGGMVTALLVDRAGRLWVGTNHDGLTRVDDPTSASPRFVTIGRAAGLLSQNVRCLVEDGYGRIYFGTSRGVGRLDPASGRITNFDSAYGLVPGMTAAALRDAGGALWFGTPRGVSRMVPHADTLDAPPLVLLGGLRIAGTPHAIADAGERLISDLVLQPDQRRLEIDVISPGAPVSRGVRYQYRLIGSDSEWSVPSDDRTFSFSLSPGAYRFEVRAVTGGGALSETPAVVAFELRAPVWQRWWFVAAMIAMAGLMAVALHRYRLRRALELERVRTRIATDLHDDIGATLSQIAILSEVARTRSNPQASEVTAPLQKIARLSGEAVDAMSDIVWALNPHRDRQVHLVQRVRRLASDMLSARNIRFHFEHSDGDDQARLGADVRREVVLIFKEALNNIVRHADCTEVAIQLRIERGCLRLAVNDNGQGFELRDVDGHGNGLRNMRHRAERLGGSLTVGSATGRGTTLDLQVPALPDH
jgi:signal transduction histidine kinase/ligand-binding sensor domain-containing protein